MDSFSTPRLRIVLNNVNRLFHVFLRIWAAMIEHIALRLKNPQGPWESLGVVYKGKLENPSHITILVVDFTTDVTPSLLAHFPSLRVVASPTTGHTHLQFDPAKQGVELITLKGEARLSEVRSVSEYTFKLILDLVRNQEGNGTTLHGKTLGILGLGRIGLQVQKIAEGFGMKVLCYDRNSGGSELKHLIQSSDVISLHMDENETTKNFISQDIISKMKPSAYFINTARPSLVDERSLIEALRKNKIAGVAMDFCPRVPITPKMNIIWSNHVAGDTRDDRLKTDEIIIDKIRGWMRGRTNTPLLPR